jgi:hypothetical protein
MEWVHSIFQTMARIGAYLVQLALCWGMLLASGAAGIAAHKWTGKRWAGWAAGILAALVLYATFWPTTEATQNISCRGASDHAACMAGDDDDGDLN